MSFDQFQGKLFHRRFSETFLKRSRIKGKRSEIISCSKKICFRMLLRYSLPILGYFGLISWIVIVIDKELHVISLRSSNLAMFLKTNLGYLSQIALRYMQFLVLGSFAFYGLKNTIKCENKAVGLYSFTCFLVGKLHWEETLWWKSYNFRRGMIKPSNRRSSSFQTDIRLAWLKMRIF